MTERHIELREGFGKWLRSLIDDRKLTQGQAAKKIGISRTHLSRILAGDTGIRFDTGVAIADAFGLSTDETLHRAGFASGQMDESLPVEMIQFLRLPPEARDIIRAHIKALETIYRTEEVNKDSPKKTQ